MSFLDELNRKLDEYKNQQQEQERVAQATQAEDDRRDREQQRINAQRLVEATRFFKQVNAVTRFEATKNKVWGLGNIEQDDRSITLSLSYKYLGSRSVQYSMDDIPHDQAWVMTAKQTMTLSCEPTSESTTFTMSFKSGTESNLRTEGTKITETVQEVLTWLDALLVEDSLKRAGRNDGNLPIYPNVIAREQEKIRRELPNESVGKQKGFWESIFG